MLRSRFYSRSFRLYSQLNTTAKHPSSSSLPPSTPPPPTRKQKIDLRPKPIKGSLTVKAQPFSKPPEPLSLNEAKQAAQHDITDAQRHGIIPPPPPGASWARQTLHKVIELAKFYYRGVKLIFIRRKQILAIRERINAGGPPLTRSEFRFIQTQKDDVNKVIPFIIIALLLEEVIPLIAIYAPFMLPSTCVLPSQRDRIEAKKAEKALASATSSKQIFAALKQRIDSSNQLPILALKNVQGASTTVCSVLGLSTLGVDALRIRRIRRHLDFIAQDDKLLDQDQLALPIHQVKDALAERGLLPQPKATSLDNRNLLLWWLDSVKNHQSEDPVAARLSLIVSRQ